MILDAYTHGQSWNERTIKALAKSTVLVNSPRTSMSSGLKQTLDILYTQQKEKIHSICIIFYIIDRSLAVSFWPQNITY